MSSSSDRGRGASGGERCSGSSGGGGCGRGADLREERGRERGRATAEKERRAGENKPGKRHSSVSYIHLTRSTHSSLQR